MATTTWQPHDRGMTSSGELEPHEWRKYFHAIAIDSDGVLATVAVIAARADSSQDLPQRPLRDIGYDRSDDVLEVAVGGIVASSATLRYFVSAPRTILVAESDHERAILVDDESGIRTLIRLFDLRCPYTSDHGDPPRSTPWRRRVALQRRSSTTRTVRSRRSLAPRTIPPNSSVRWT